MWLNMCCRNVKYDRFVAITCVFQALNIPKLVFCRGSAPDPGGEFTTLLQTSRPAECSVDSYSHWNWIHFYFRSTSVFNALEVYYDNALYKFTFDIDIDLLVSWGGGVPIRFPPRRLRRLDLGAFGASLVRFPTQIPGYAHDVWLLMFAFISG